MIINDGFSSSKTGFNNLVNRCNSSIEGKVQFSLDEDVSNFINEEYDLDDGELDNVCLMTNRTGCCQNEEEFFGVVTEAISAKKSDEYIHSRKNNYKVRPYEELIAVSILKREGELSSYDLPDDYFKHYV